MLGFVDQADPNAAVAQALFQHPAQRRRRRAPPGRDRFVRQDRNHAASFASSGRASLINCCSNLRRSVVLPAPVGLYSRISDGAVG